MKKTRNLSKSPSNNAMDSQKNTAQPQNQQEPSDKQLPQISENKQEQSPTNENDKKDNKPEIIHQPTDKMMASTMPTFKQNKMEQTKMFFMKQFERTMYQIRQRSKSPKNKPIVPTIRRGNGIPIKTIDKMNFFGDIFNNEKFINHFKKAPNPDKCPIDQIVDFLAKFKGKKGELETIAMFYYYVCKSISYDANAKRERHFDVYYKKPENVIRNKYALADGFVNLFCYMCNRKGFKVKPVSGYCKLLPTSLQEFHKENSSKNLTKSSSGRSILTAEEPKPKTIINHTWATYFYKGEWYFFDPFLGAGGTYVRKVEEKPMCNFFYFFTSPDLMIITHRPEDDDFQFYDKTITYPQFLKRRFCDLGKFYQNAYDYQIEILNYDFPLITASNKTPLVFQYKKLETYFQGELFTNNYKEKLGEIKNETDEFTNITSFYPTFPGNGDYILKIYARSYISSDLLYNDVYEYKIKIGEATAFSFRHSSLAKKRQRKLSTTYLPSNLNKSLPSLSAALNKMNNRLSLPKINAKRICLDNEGAYLIEPKQNQYLKKGAETMFKVRISGARSVAVLDGKKMNFLKRLDENLFTGLIVIQTDNVSICSLRNSNVYTEVFNLKVKGEQKKYKYK